MSDQINKLEDLPELESVDAKIPAPMFLMVIVLAFAGMIIVPFVMYWRVLGDQWLVSTVLVGMIAALALWVIYRCFTSGYYWKTDANGITQRSALGTKFIGWHEVTFAGIVSGPLGGGYVRIASSRTKLAVPIGIRGARYILLCASIWQHLRRLGKADDALLGYSALSYWDEIPDVIPHEMEQKVSRRTEFIVAVIFWAFMASLFVLVSFTGKSAPDIKLLFTSEVLIAIVFVVLLKSIPANYFRLDDDHIEARWHRQSITIPRQNIVSAEWVWGNEQRVHLFITSKDPRRQTVVQYSPNDDDSCRFILGVIRNLRSAGVLVEIPEALRAPFTSIDASSTNAVIIRLPRFFRYIAPWMPLMMAVLAPIVRTLSDKPMVPADWCMLIILSVVSLILAARAVAHRVQADNHGISVRTIFGTKSMNWDEVASYERNSNFCVIGIRLKSSDSRTSIHVSREWFTLHEWEPFVAFLDSKLAHLIPVREDKPWLTRPRVS